MEKRAQIGKLDLDRLDLLVLIGILVLSLISRFILISDSNSILHGDECIQGLMAKHLLEGKDMSFYFYGQAYGFSFLENVFIATAFKIHGFGEESLKIGIFTLWFLGTSFLYLFLRSLAEKKFRWIIALLILVFALSPAWISFSTQARAGYVSAYALSCFSLFLWQKLKTRKRLIIFQAFLFVLIYECQPLWLPPLIPFIIYYLWPLKPMRKWFLFAITSLVVFNLFAIYKSSLDDFWSPKIFSPSWETLGHNFQILWEKVFQNFSGLYYLEVDREVPVFISIFVIVYLCILTVSLLYGMYRIIFRKQNFGLDLAFLISILSILFLSLFLKTFSTRYLIPLMGFSIFPVFHFLIHQKKGVHLFGGFLLLAAVCIVPPNFPKAYFHPEERTHLNTNLEVFDSLDYKYAFVMDPLMQWQIMFYTNEEIICRYHSARDRYPAYSEAVNAALKRGDDYLLFGRSYRMRKPYTPNVQTINGGYSFILKPSPLQLKSNGFKIPRD